jgi:hypothetical protein
MSKIQDVKVKRSAAFPDRFDVVGGGKHITNLSHQTAQDIAGARRRVIIKHALRKVGIKTMPRSLSKQAKRRR